MEIRKEVVMDSIDIEYTTDIFLEGVKKFTENISQNNVFFRHLGRELPATEQDYNDRILLSYTISNLKYQRQTVSVLFLMYK